MIALAVLGAVLVAFILVGVVVDWRERQRAHRLHRRGALILAAYRAASEKRYSSMGGGCG